MYRIVSDKTLRSEFANGRATYIESLLAWHKKLANRQRELAANFNIDLIEEFSVNIWDEIDDKGETYCYVEMADEVPDGICFGILTHIMDYARSQYSIKETGVEFKIEFFDSSILFPNLIGRPDGEYSLYKRWQISLIGVDQKTLDIILKQLKKVPNILNKPIDIYSES